jgi:amino acid transporter, AAT family
LISSGGFAILFTYCVIMATHIRFRKINGCPPEGKCQVKGYPYSSWIVLISMIGIIFSMPFVSGQSSGLVVGVIMTIVYSTIYMVMKT